MFCIISIITVFVVLCAIYHEYSKRKQMRYFEDRGVHPQVPQLILFRLREFATNNVADLLQKLYNSFENHRVVGFFNSNVPNYFVRDPALVKQIAVKDFDHFVDHLKVVDVNHDQFFGNTLIALDGSKWREMRSTLSPAFTGSKMRLMFQLVLQCSQNMTDYFRDQCKLNGPQSYDMKDIYYKYTNDVIASCAFGIKCDSFREPENDFYKIGKRIANFLSAWNMFKFIIYRLLPWKIVTELLDIRLVDREGQKVFSEIILTTMKMREEKNISRPDMINLLMEMKKGQLKASTEVETNESIATVDDHTHPTTESKLVLTDELLVPQCFIFFLAGFETSSTLMTFVAYELAVNKDIQDRLIEEVDRTVDELAGKPIDYDRLQSMIYLDMVIAETLRKWPPVPLIDRLCVKDYKYEGDDGFKMIINKGADVMVPIYALHRDPQYYPEPEKFDPERFSPENKANINVNAYIPFGIGPRSCIGSRFALMETKAVIYHLLLNFTLEVGDKTQVPIKLKKTMAGVIPEPIELVLKPRREL